MSTTAFHRANTNAEYHADTVAISKSMLSRFIASPLDYHDCYVSKTVDPWSTSTPSLRLGTIVHTLVLEPERANSTFAVAPRWALSKCGGKSGSTWQRFKRSIGGRLPITQDELDAANRMATGVLDTLPEFVAIQGAVERSFYWTDEATGLEQRCRPDKLFLFEDRAVLFDLKTEGRQPFSPSFEQAYDQYGYGLQAAHYSVGIEKCLGRHVQFRFAVVDPDGHTRLYAPPKSSLEESLAFRSQVLASISECFSTGIWPEQFTLAV